MSLRLHAGSKHSFPTANAHRPISHWQTAVGWTVASLWSNINQWRERRHAALMLRELDDHTLQDIGVHRCEIEAVLRNGQQD